MGTVRGHGTTHIHFSPDGHYLVFGGVGYVQLCAVEVVDRFTEVEVKGPKGRVERRMEPQRVTPGLERPEEEEGGEGKGGGEGKEEEEGKEASAVKGAEGADGEAAGDGRAEEDGEQGSGDEDATTAAAAVSAGSTSDTTATTTPTITPSANTPAASSDAVIRVRRLKKNLFGDAIITGIDFATDSDTLRFTSKHGFAGSFVTKTHFIRVQDQKIIDLRLVRGGTEGG